MNEFNDVKALFSRENNEDSPRNNAVGTIIFDLDGVLLDSAKAIQEIISEMLLARGGSPISIADLRPHLSKGGLELVKSSLGDLARDASEDLRQFRSMYLDTRPDATHLFLNVTKSLEQLRSAGFKLGICSNKPVALARLALKYTGIENLIDAVVADDGALPLKPKPDTLLHCCHLLKAEPGRVLFVGDSEIDHVAAARAGAAFVWASYGYPISAASFKTVSHSIDRFDQLIPIVDMLIATGHFEGRCLPLSELGFQAYQAHS